MRTMVCVDVSGSMSAELQHAVKRLVSRYAQTSEVIVVEFDIEVQRVGRSDAFLATLPLAGRGTDPNCLFHPRILDFVRPDIIVVLSDGMFGTVYRPVWMNLPVIWINLNNNDMSSKWGLNMSFPVNPPEAKPVPAPVKQPETTLYRTSACLGCPDLRTTKHVKPRFYCLRADTYRRAVLLSKIHVGQVPMNCLRRDRHVRVRAGVV